MSQVFLQFFFLIGMTMKLPECCESKNEILKYKYGFFCPTKLITSGVLQEIVRKQLQLQLLTMVGSQRGFKQQFREYLILGPPVVRFHLHLLFCVLYNMNGIG